MIYVGLDDTDIIDHPGTNQLARRLVTLLSDEYRVRLILRHQLLEDPRVPCTSRNGSASLLLEPKGDYLLATLCERLCAAVRDWCPPGSDPGLCVAASVPQSIVEWGYRCQNELVTQELARELAAQCGLFLEGLGGDQGGVIGALAAVGLMAGSDDGRVIYVGSAVRDYYDLGGAFDVAELLSFGIDEVRCMESNLPIQVGIVDVGKRLRPNCERGKIVLFVRPATESLNPPIAWQAVRVT